MFPVSSSRRWKMLFPRLMVTQCSASIESKDNAQAAAVQHFCGHPSNVRSPFKFLPYLSVSCRCQLEAWYFSGIRLSFRCSSEGIHACQPLMGLSWDNTRCNTWKKAPELRTDYYLAEGICLHNKTPEGMGHIQSSSSL